MGYQSTKLLAVMLISGAGLGLAGCHTAQGVKEDVSAGYHDVTGTSSSSSNTSTASNAPATSSSASTSSTPAATASSTTPPATQPQATSGSTGPTHMSRAEIRQAQTKLHADGYYNGPIDGIVGPKTRSAVTAFQNKQGMPANGELDAATVASLNNSKM